jgi:hypothetical protein
LQNKQNRLPLLRKLPLPPGKPPPLLRKPLLPPRKPLLPPRKPLLPPRKPLLLPRKPLLLPRKPLLLPKKPLLLPKKPLLLPRKLLLLLKRRVHERKTDFCVFPKLQHAQSIMYSEQGEEDNTVGTNFKVMVKNE